MTDNTAPMIQLDHVSKIYNGIRAVDDVSLTIARGTRVIAAADYFQGIMATALGGGNPRPRHRGTWWARRRPIMLSSASESARSIRRIARLATLSS